MVSEELEDIYRKVDESYDDNSISDMKEKISSLVDCGNEMYDEAEKTISQLYDLIIRMKEKDFKSRDVCDELLCILSAYASCEEVMSDIIKNHRDEKSIQILKDFGYGDIKPETKVTDSSGS